MGEVTVNFIAKAPWRMVLVEQVPWQDTQAELLRLQDRLYTCMDAAIDGQLAEQFPESSGEEVTIELHGYSLPPDAVEFFSRFSEGALQLPEFANAITQSPHIAALKFAAEYE